MKKNRTTQTIATISILVALMVVLSQVFGFETQFLKITLAFVPEIVMANLFGPFWTGLGAVLADVIGNTFLAKAPFFIGFTLNALIEGVVYGYFFYGKKITLKRAFFAVLINTLVVTLCLTPIWLAFMYQVPLFSKALWSVRILKAVIMLPLQTGLIYFFGKALPLEHLRKKLK